MRILCSPPAFLDLSHLLNVWMRWDEEVDRALAVRQWEGLVGALEQAGAEVAVMPPDPRAPAMTFTRDLGVVVGDEVVTLTNLGPRGEKEPRRARRWLRANGVPTRRWDPTDRVEGGNVVRCAWGWLIGVRAGIGAEPTRRFARHLRATTDDEVAIVPLPDARFGHLDMVLADLGPLWLAHPPALELAGFGDDRWRPILGDRAVVAAEDDEVDRLAVNVVRVGDTVVGDLSHRLCRVVEQAGLAAVPVELGELRKAGGGAHCLTLELPDPVGATTVATDVTADARSGRAVSTGTMTGGDRRPWDAAMGPQRERNHR